MGTVASDRCRAFQRVCERLEFVVRAAPDLRRSNHYRVGTSLVILLPGDIRGVRAAEVEIAYHLCLAALDEVGEDRFVRGVAALLLTGRAPYGPVASVGLGAGVAAD